MAESDQLPYGPPLKASRRHAAATNSPPSLHDVARAAGVSTASASRALTRPELVSDGIRERVLLAAKRLGYAGNAAARFLSGRRSGLVGAVIGPTIDPVGWQMLHGAESALASQGIGLLVQVGSTAAFNGAAQSLLARGVDGLLVVGLPAARPAEIGAIREVPWVACGQEPQAGGDAGNDQSLEARGLLLARTYLEQLGHRGIGILVRAGAKAGAASRAPSPAKTVVHSVENHHDSDVVRAAVRALRAAGGTAIVLGSDLAAAAAMRECRTLALNVPRQMSVIGWGDTDLARNLDPPLTSVRVAAYASGRAAAEYLIAAMAGREFRWPDLPPKLVIRDSTAPPEV